VIFLKDTRVKVGLLGALEINLTAPLQKMRSDAIELGFRGQMQEHTASRKKVRNASRSSPTRTGTAVSHKPAKQ